jgi:hypothetical protein
MRYLPEYFFRGFPVTFIMNVDGAQKNIELKTLQHQHEKTLALKK